MYAESPQIEVRTVLIDDAQALHQLEDSFETDRIYTLHVQGRLTPTSADAGFHPASKPVLAFELFETPVDPPLYKSYREFERTVADVEATLRGVQGGFVALANGQVAGVIVLSILSLGASFDAMALDHYCSVALQTGRVIFIVGQYC